MSWFFVAMFLGAKVWSFECPTGFQFEKISSDRARCIYSGIQPPRSGSPRDYCHYVSLGYIGYVWDLDDDNADYRCPPYLHLMRNHGLGTGYCIADTFEPPPDVKPSCEDFESHGIISFSYFHK